MRSDQEEEDAPPPSEALPASMHGKRRHEGDDEPRSHQRRRYVSIPAASRWESSQGPASDEHDGRVGEHEQRVDDDDGDDWFYSDGELERDEDRVQSGSDGDDAGHEDDEDDLYADGELPFELSPLKESKNVSRSNSDASFAPEAEDGMREGASENRFDPSRPRHVDSLAGSFPSSSPSTRRGLECDAAIKSGRESRQEPPQRSPPPAPAPAPQPSSSSLSSPAAAVSSSSSRAVPVDLLSQVSESTAMSQPIAHVDSSQPRASSDGHGSSFAPARAPLDALSIASSPPPLSPGPLSQFELPSARSHITPVRVRHALASTRESHVMEPTALDETCSGNAESPAPTARASASAPSSAASAVSTVSSVAPRASRAVAFALPAVSVPSDSDGESGDDNSTVDPPSPRATVASAAAAATSAPVRRAIVIPETQLNEDDYSLGFAPARRAPVAAPAAAATSASAASSSTSSNVRRVPSLIPLASMAYDDTEALYPNRLRESNDAPPVVPASPELAASVAFDDVEELYPRRAAVRPRSDTAARSDSGTAAQGTTTHSSRPAAELPMSLPIASREASVAFDDVEHLYRGGVPPPVPPRPLDLVAAPPGTVVRRRSQSATIPSSTSSAPASTASSSSSSSSSSSASTPSASSKSSTGTAPLPRSTSRVKRESPPDNAGALLRTASNAKRGRKTGPYASRNDMPKRQLTLTCMFADDDEFFAAPIVPSPAAPRSPHAAVASGGKGGAREPSSPSLIDLEASNDSEADAVATHGGGAASSSAASAAAAAAAAATTTTTASAATAASDDSDRDEIAALFESDEESPAETDDEEYVDTLPKTQAPPAPARRVVTRAHSDPSPSSSSETTPHRVPPRAPVQVDDDSDSDFEVSTRESGSLAFEVPEAPPGTRLRGYGPPRR